MGLPRVEFERRIGLKPSVARLATVAALEDGVLVETVPNAYFNSENACPDGGFVSMLWRHGPAVGPYTREEQPLSPPAMFRDGLYAGPVGPVAAAAGDPALPASIVTTCTKVNSGINPGMAVLLPLVPVHVGLVAAFNAGKPGLNDINPTLASLSLGAPPPGGLEAWLANLPKDVLLLSREGARAEVGIYAWKPLKPEVHRSYWAVKVVFQEGRVSRLAEGVNATCAITASRAFQCRVRS